MQSNAGVFLSHSSIDKPLVIEIAKLLGELGVRTWVDSAEITAGDAWREKIEAGLKTCSHFAIALSKNSVRSGWVSAELDIAIQSNIEMGFPVIIPIRLDDTETPLFLKKYHHIECSAGVACAKQDFEKIFKDSAISNVNKSWVTKSTRNHLSGMSREKITFPIANPIPIVEHLKILPRSGKMVRLFDFEPKLEIRSVYDHIRSLAHTADCFWPTISHGLSKSDISNVATCIAFHELNEVLIGDIPYLTDLDQEYEMRWLSRLHGYSRLNRFDYDDREFITNEYIKMHLNDKNRAYMSVYQKINTEKKSNTYNFFKLLDKLDPIICIWRYLHKFNKLISQNRDNFFERMADFFNNDDVRDFTLNYEKDQRVGVLTSEFLSVDNAYSYLENREILDRVAYEASFPAPVLKHLIHGHKMEFAKRLREISSDQSGT